MAAPLQPGDTRAARPAQGRGRLPARPARWSLAALALLLLPSLAWPQPYEGLYRNRRERLWDAVPVQRCGTGGTFAAGESWAGRPGRPGSGRALR